MRTGARLKLVSEQLEGLVADGGFFDLLVRVDSDIYEELPAALETLGRDGDGTLFFAKAIQLAGGTVTVETAYERVAA